MVSTGAGVSCSVLVAVVLVSSNKDLFFLYETFIHSFYEVCLVSVLNLRSY